MINQEINVQPIASLVESNLVVSALRCLETQLRHSGIVLNNSKDVSAYLQMQLANEKNEVFSVIFLDNSHRLLAFEKLFHGTINEVTVYPRRVVQRALEHNAAAVILAHNHPSGECKPSSADREITQVLWTILKIIDVCLLDHMIVSNQNSYSFVEHGLL